MTTYGHHETCGICHSSGVCEHTLATLDEPQDAASSGETCPAGGATPPGVASCDFSGLPPLQCSHCGGTWDASEIAHDPQISRVRSNLSHTPDHHSNHWTEDCRILLRMADAQAARIVELESYAQGLAKLTDELRAKLADAQEHERDERHLRENAEDRAEEAENKLAEAEHHQETHKRQSRGWEEAYDKACAKLKEVKQRERLHHGADLTRALQRAEAAEAKLAEAEYQLAEEKNANANDRDPSYREERLKRENGAMAVHITQLFAKLAEAESAQRDLRRLRDDLTGRAEAAEQMVKELEAAVRAIAADHGSIRTEHNR